MSDLSTPLSAKTDGAGNILIMDSADRWLATVHHDAPGATEVAALILRGPAMLTALAGVRSILSGVLTCHTSDKTIQEAIVNLDSLTEREDVPRESSNMPT